ncbi:MAG: hypothetical protein E7122_09495 [Bacteroidales bacterium]|nr:hypothetical protein [Bacteroidales bacterium]
MEKKENSGGRKRSPLLFGITFRAILLVAAAAMCLSYVAVYVNPAKFSLPLFFGLYFIPIFLLNLFLLIIAILRRSASAWITVVALLPSLLYTELFFKIGHEEKIYTEGIRLKVESYNVGMFSSSKEGFSREECRREIARHIKTESPDIVCLQEFFVEDRTQADTLFVQYPHRHYHLFKAKNGKLFGNIILSKYPMGEKGRISFPGSTNLSIYSDIKHFGRKIRVYNNHLESYNVSFTALAHKFGSKENLNTEEITHDIVQTHEKMKGTFIKRSEQVDRILENINSNSKPTIICGDFNDTPMSYTYHTLAKDRKDTFKEAGRGFGATFSTLWPLLRIDYILVPQNAECATHNAQKINLSDHYPVISEIII